MARSWANTQTRHGSHSGWSLHSQLNEEPCTPCWNAKSEYDKRRLEAPDLVVRNRLRARAQGRAETRLVRAYKSEYDFYYQQELEKVFAEEGVQLT